MCAKEAEQKKLIGKVICFPSGDTNYLIVGLATFEKPVKPTNISDTQSYAIYRDLNDGRLFARERLETLSKAEFIGERKIKPDVQVKAGQKVLFAGAKRKALQQAMGLEETAEVPIKIKQVLPLFYKLVE